MDRSKSRSSILPGTGAGEVSHKAADSTLNGTYGTSSQAARKKHNTDSPMDIILPKHRYEAPLLLEVNHPIMQAKIKELEAENIALRLAIGEEEVNTYVMIEAEGAAPDKLGGSSGDPPIEDETMTLSWEMGTTGIEADDIMVSDGVVENVSDEALKDSTIGLEPDVPDSTTNTHAAWRLAFSKLRPRTPSEPSVASSIPPDWATSQRKISSLRVEIKCLKDEILELKKGNQLDLISCSSTRSYEDRKKRDALLAVIAHGELVLADMTSEADQVATSPVLGLDTGIGSSTTANDNGAQSITYSPAASPTASPLSVRARLREYLKTDRERWTFDPDIDPDDDLYA